MSDQDGYEEVVLLFDAKLQGIDRELKAEEFRALVDGAAPAGGEPGASGRVSAVFAVVAQGLSVRGMVFFTFKVAADGTIDPGFNLPLRYLADSAGAGPDLGAGPIRLACRGQCPVPWHSVNLWQPQTDADPSAMQMVQSAIWTNRLGIKPTAPMDQPEEDGLLLEDDPGEYAGPARHSIIEPDPEPYVLPPDPRDCAPPAAPPDTNGQDRGTVADHDPTAAPPPASPADPVPPPAGFDNPLAPPEGPADPPPPAAGGAGSSRPETRPETNGANGAARSGDSSAPPTFGSPRTPRVRPFRPRPPGNLPDRPGGTFRTPPPRVPPPPIPPPVPDPALEQDFLASQRELESRLTETFGEEGRISMENIIRQHNQRLTEITVKHRADLAEQQRGYLEQIRACREEIQQLKATLRHEQQRSRRLQSLLRGDP